VTVCIAARCGPILVGASDRMLTSGDIQFEPPLTSKLTTLTTSIAVLQAGDAAFHTEIMTEVVPIVHERITAVPSEWWLVKDVADLYVKHRNAAKLKRAEAAILAPLGLTRDSFPDNQQKLNEAIAEQITRDLINYDVPYVSALVVGVDPLGPHIYVIDDGNISCNDVIGFAAIGIGARHAESQFMLGRHSWSSPVADTALLTYAAKKRSEIAPGVGEATDMFTAGPQLGTFMILSDPVVQRFDRIYRRMIRGEERAQRNARKEANQYVNELQGKPAGEQQAEIPEESTNEGKPPLEGQGTGAAGGKEGTPF
jgi:hypothetical protein